MDTLIQQKDVTTIEGDLEDQRRLVSVGHIIRTNPDLSNLLKEMYLANLQLVARIDPIKETDRDLAVAMAKSNGKLVVLEYLYNLGLNQKDNAEAYSQALKQHTTTE